MTATADPTAEDWTASDALRVLALAVNRWRGRAHDWGDGVRDMTYSNGTEQEIAVDTADLICDDGPMLRRVLEAGVRALADDELFDSYIVALYAGASDDLLAIEALLRDEHPPLDWDKENAEREASAKTVANAMIADLKERYGVTEDLGL